MLKYDLQQAAVIHDLSGYGRSSLTVVLPVLAVMGIQACPLPTAVLSSQTTNINDFTFLDLTPELEPMLDHWQRLGLRFGAVYSGFLGNPKQAQAVVRCFEQFTLPDALRLVDPVLGDNGSLDPTQGPAMIEAMRFLISQATLITPNLTEAAFLLGEDYNPNLAPDALRRQLKKLAELGPNQVVITSAPGSRPGLTACLAYDALKNQAWRIENEIIDAYYPGTGDCFASVLCGARLRGIPLAEAVAQAACFVAQALQASKAADYPPQGGIALEQVLHLLCGPALPGSVERF